MGLTADQRDRIGRLLTEAIERKLTRRQREPSAKPFLERLVGHDRLVVYSLSHSISTTLGQSFFEQAAVIVAEPRFRRVERGYQGLNCTISPAAQTTINQIINDLGSKGAVSDKADETRRILAVSQARNTIPVERETVDLYLEAPDGAEYCIDLKTAKPNKGEFAGLKRRLLNWVAMRGAEDSSVRIETMLAIPYNPYAPEPYERWTKQWLFDARHELLVAEEFWGFLGGEGTYEDLLSVFDDVGARLSEQIEEAFSRPEAVVQTPPHQLELW